MTKQPYRAAPSLAALPTESFETPLAAKAPCLLPAAFRRGGTTPGAPPRTADSTYRDSAPSAEDRRGPLGDLMERHQYLMGAQQYFMAPNQYLVGAH